MEIPKPPKKNKPSHLRNAAMLSGIAFQMGATIYFANKGGLWLDAHYQTNNEIFMIIVTLMGVAISIWVVVLQLKKIKY